MRGTDLSIIKESFELFNSSNSSYSISSHRAMAKNERRSMSDPSEVMGGSDLRCLKPQSQKFQSRELEIAFEHKSAQWELFYHVIQNSIWDLSRSKEKKGRIRLKNHSWIMSTGRERNGGEKWSIPKAEKTKKKWTTFQIWFCRNWNLLLNSHWRRQITYQVGKRKTMIKDKRLFFIF